MNSNFVLATDVGRLFGIYGVCEWSLVYLCHPIVRLFHRRRVSQYITAVLYIARCISF